MTGRKWLSLSLSLRQSHAKCRRGSIGALRASVKKMSCCFRTLNRKDVKDLPPREVVGWVGGFVEMWFG